MRRSTRYALVGALAFVIAASAAACGGDDDEGTTSAAAPATSAAATTEAAATSAAAETTAAAETSAPAEESTAPAEESTEASAPAEESTAAAAQPLDASSCDGATLSFIGLAGEEGDKELKAWRDDVGMTLQVNNTPDWGQLIGAIKVGQEHDLATIPYWQAQRMIKAGTFQPIDVTKLTNWNDIVPALREEKLLRDADGKVYGVPIAWGDGPVVYSPERVPTPPQSISELMTPEWKGRYTMFDDPSLPFFMVAQSLGFTNAPLLTKDELEQVKTETKKLVDNAAAFQASYQDATDRLVAGDVDLAIGGWEAMTAWAKEKGVTLDFGFLKESKGGGWWDGIAIPSTAKNPECALAYIDQLISVETQAQLATNLVSGAANGKAKDLVGPDAKIYDYSLVESEMPGIEFVSAVPPEETEDGIANFQDWQDAWQEIKG